MYTSLNCTFLNDASHIKYLYYHEIKRGGNSQYNKG